MTGTTEPLEMLSVSDEHLTVEEELSRKNGGWVISFTLSAQGDRPVAVRISVPMPDEPERQDVGFHPRHEPETWSMKGGVLTFEDRVPSDEPLQILLGIVLAGDDDDVTLSLSEPTIELSQPVEEGDEGNFLSTESPIFRSGSESEEQPQSPSEPEDGIEAPVEAEAPSAVQRESESLDEAESESGEQRAAEGGLSIEEDFDLEHLGEIQEDLDLDLESEEATLDPEESARPEEEDSSGEMFSTQADTGTESGQMDMSASSTPDAESTSSDVLSRLVEQLDSSDDDEAVARLRELLRPEREKTTDVRLRHVQSRMDDLAAYTEALEGLINKHGTASEFMNHIESELDEVNSEMAALRQQTEQAESKRGEFDDRLADVEGSIDDFQSRAETIYDDLDSLKTTVESGEERIRNIREAVYDHDDELEGLSDQLDSQGDELEDHRATMESKLSEMTERIDYVERTIDSDLGRIEEEVESLARMREVFARAFSGEELASEMDELSAEDEEFDADD